MIRDSDLGSLAVAIAFSAVEIPVNMLSPGGRLPGVTVASSSSVPAEKPSSTFPLLGSSDMTFSLVSDVSQPLQSWCGTSGDTNPSECASLIDLATPTEDWKPAGLSAHEEIKTVHTDFRHGDRVSALNRETAAMVYERLRPYLKEIQEIAPGERWACVTGKAERKQGPTWRMTGVKFSPLRPNELF